MTFGALRADRAARRRVRRRGRHHRSERPAGCTDVRRRAAPGELPPPSTLHAMSRRRVVVTGMGIVSPVGVGLTAAWDAIRNARSGVAPITRFDCSTFPTRIAAEVKDFDVAKYLSAKEARRYDTFIHYGLAATMDAVGDAGLADYAGDKERVGVCIGSGIGGLPLIEDTKAAYMAGGWRKITPFFVPGSIVNMVAGLASIQYGFQGPNLAIVSACSSSNHSIGEAGRLIEYGDADVMVAGGAEATVSALGIGGFCAARALSTRNDDPATASRPWDVGPRRLRAGRRRRRPGARGIRACARRAARGSTASSRATG